MKNLMDFLQASPPSLCWHRVCNGRTANGGNGENKPEGELAYMTITINDVNAFRVRQKAVT